MEEIDSPGARHWLQFINEPVCWLAVVSGAEALKLVTAESAN